MAFSPHERRRWCCLYAASRASKQASKQASSALLCCLVAWPGARDRGPNNAKAPKSFSASPTLLQPATGRYLFLPPMGWQAARSPRRPSRGAVSRTAPDATQISCGADRPETLGAVIWGRHEAVHSRLQPTCSRPPARPAQPQHEDCDEKSGRGPGWGGVVCGGISPTPHGCRAVGRHHHCPPGYPRIQGPRGCMPGCLRRSAGVLASARWCHCAQGWGDGGCSSLSSSLTSSHAWPRGRRAVRLPPTTREGRPAPGPGLGRSE